MRKNFLIMVAILTLGVSTLAQENEKYKDNDKDRIEGSGNMITKEVTVRSFDELTAHGIFNLQLSQGEKEQVKIEADDNLMDLFIVENDGSALNIHMKKDVHFNSKKKMTVYVTLKL